MKRDPTLRGALDRSADSTRPSSEMIKTLWLRPPLALFGIVLGAQAAWILMPELSHSRHVPMPLDQKSATILRIEQEKIRHSASLAAVRGDLWAESAFAYGGQLLVDQAMELDPGDRPTFKALHSLSQSLRYAPHRGDVWLMLAAMTTRHNLKAYKTGALLKMSYYTAPNQSDLIPLRLNVSLHEAGLIEDDELREMVRLDIDYILTRSPSLKPALVAAYKSASKQGKTFIEQVVSQIEPTYLDVVRTRYP